MPANAAPLQISSYHILPLSLPPLPAVKSLPPATHYLYLRPHSPKIPDPDTPRSLFLVNVPFDATEVHLKTLFSTQLGLPAGRVAEIRFEGAHKKATFRPSAEGSDASRGILKSGSSQLEGGTRGKKRKRERVDAEEDIESMEGMQLPRTWDREVLRAGSTAVVVFVDRASVEAVVKAVRRVRKRKDRIVWGEGVEGKVPALGSARYLAHHKLCYPDKAILLETVNNYMTAYATQESAKKRKLQRQRQEPDEDGFVMVTKGGRTGPARQEEAKERLEKQKDRQKGLEDFYRFQSREKRKERAGELVRRFEEDREKVRRMKERRGAFKPE